jgi:hypothetical protein
MEPLGQIAMKIVTVPLATELVPRTKEYAPVHALKATREFIVTKVCNCTAG